jgi:protein SCO1/2
MKRSQLLISGIALAGIALIAAAWFFWFKPPTLHGTLLTNDVPAADFTLHTTAGKTVSLQDFRGKVVLLYFGYTHCPDVCPATLAEVRVAMAELGRRADDIQVIMVSVDPERDTPERLADYVSRFDQRFLGISGTLDEVSAIATAYGIYFRKHEGSEATGYLVDHSAQLLAIDRRGNTRMVFPFGVHGEELAKDIRYILSF